MSEVPTCDEPFGRELIVEWFSCVDSQLNFWNTEHYSVYSVVSYYSPILHRNFDIPLSRSRKLVISASCFFM
jgi:hypothetical protein